MQKQSGQEHWVLDNKGNLKGLYALSGQKALDVYGKRDLWQAVDQIVRQYAQIHPNEIKEQRIENQLTRDNTFNEYASNQTGTFRQALEIPVGLFNVLFEYESTLFTNKKTLHEFMKRYPIFTTAKSI
jgi:hypothetical protein